MSLDGHCDICGNQATPLRLCDVPACPKHLCDTCLLAHEDESHDQLCEKCAGNVYECHCGEDEEEEIGEG